MTKVHRMEFWHYLASGSAQAVLPHDIHIQQSDSLVCLEQTLDFPEVQKEEPLVVARSIPEEVERTWAEGLANNPKLKNNLKPNIRRISPDGKSIDAVFATYKTSFWLKNCLSNYPFEVQEQIARQFPFFNIGIVTVTSDAMILLERRPDGVTAPRMLLTYPCGYLSRGEKTLADTVNAQAKAELGFVVFGEDGQRLPHVRYIHSIGMQRESDEWTPNYTFVMYLDIPASVVKPTKETKEIVHFPAADSERLIEEIAKAYSPTIKGPDARGKLVPNAVGMLALYLKTVFVESEYQNLLDTLSHVARKNGHELEVVEYTPQTNPFR